MRNVLSFFVILLWAFNATAQINCDLPPIQFPCEWAGDEQLVLDSMNTVADQVISPDLVTDMQCADTDTTDAILALYTVPAQHNCLEDWIDLQGDGECTEFSAHSHVCDNSHTTMLAWNLPGNATWVMCDPVTTSPDQDFIVTITLDGADKVTVPYLSFAGVRPHNLPTAPNTPNPLVGFEIPYVINQLGDTIWQDEAYVDLNLLPNQWDEYKIYLSNRVTLYPGGTDEIQIHLRGVMDEGHEDETGMFGYTEIGYAELCGCGVCGEIDVVLGPEEFDDIPYCDPDGYGDPIGFYIVDECATFTAGGVPTNATGQGLSMMNFVDIYAPNILADPAYGFAWTGTMQEFWDYILNIDQYIILSDNCDPEPLLGVDFGIDCETAVIPISATDNCGNISWSQVVVTITNPSDCSDCYEPEEVVLLFEGQLFLPGDTLYHTGCRGNVPNIYNFDFIQNYPGNSVMLTHDEFQTKIDGNGNPYTLRKMRFKVWGTCGDFFFPLWIVYSQECAGCESENGEPQLMSANELVLIYNDDIFLLGDTLDFTLDDCGNLPDSLLAVNLVGLPAGSMTLPLEIIASAGNPLFVKFRIKVWTYCGDLAFVFWGNIPEEDCFENSLQPLLDNPDTAEDLDLRETLSAKEMMIFPNPATDHVTISGASGLVQVYGLTGELYWTGQVNGDRVLDVSQWPKGIYVIRAVNDGTTQKLVVVH